MPRMVRPESVNEVIERIGRIPAEYREFTVPGPPDKSFGIGGELLSELLDRGLPSSGHGAARRFDPLDLLNIGIELGLPCGSWRRMQLWSKALAALAGHSAAAYRLSMTVQCPDPGHQGDCPLLLNPCLARALAPGALRPEGAGFAMEPLIGARHESLASPLLPALAGLLGDAGAPRFHLLPPDLSVDLEFGVLTGLADPRLATRMLVAAAQRRGLAVRPAAGMLLMRPSAMPHEWLEVQHDGGWIAADPFMLTALARWGLLDPGRWPPERSLPPVAWRLFPHWNDGATRHIAGQGLVTHGADWARMSLHVRRCHPVPAPDAIATSA